ncbi:hypothetical protein RKE29_01920 [Streptomyces sp. B1866]|nr:hypothetical protein [Streptomyces sp. B1866]MDT3395417.1 hypothetical protein [Streptomyces sp. B1866]
MGEHGDGQGGAEGDQNQSPKESDGQWNRPIPPATPNTGSGQ